MQDWGSWQTFLRRFLGSKDGRVETLSPGDSVVKRKAPTVAGSAKPSFITRLLLSFGFILNSTLIYNAVYKSFIYLVHGGIHPCDPCDQKKKINHTVISWIITNKKLAKLYNFKAIQFKVKFQRAERWRAKVHKMNFFVNFSEAHKVSSALGFLL